MRLQGSDHYAAVFDTVPVPCLLLDPDLHITDVNAAFRALLRRDRDELVGRHIFEAFPSDPDNPGSGLVRDSLHRAVATGNPDRVPLLSYAVETAPGSGDFVERWWTVANLPVLDGASRVLAVEDVTDVVRERERSRVDREAADTLRQRTQSLEDDLFVRTRELAAIAQAEAQASLRLSALREAALEVAAAQTVAELTEVVIGRGMAALGADGGAVAVRDDASGVLRVSLTEALGIELHAQYAEVPLDSPLPGAVAARTGAPVVLATRDEQLAFDPGMAEVLTLTGRSAIVALPLQTSSRLLGSLSVGWEAPQQFSEADVELMTAFAAQCAQALDRLLERQAEQQAAAASRRLAEALQRSLLSEPPHVDGLRLAVRYLPAAQEAQVGGDWYDAFVTDGGPTSLVVGDVAGHDRDAAATMAQVRNVLRGVAHASRRPPAEVLAALDRALRDLGVDALATAVLAQVHAPDDAGVRTLVWSNAGHPPPLLLRADGTAELLARDPDLILGIDPGTRRGDHRVDLALGDAVLLYTDGLVERRGASIGAGLHWLRETGARLARLPLEDLCHTLLADIGGRVADDVALLGLRVEPASTALELRPGPASATGARRAPDRGDPPDIHRLVVPREAEAVRTARSFVRSRCAVAGVDADARDTAVLLTSEVVTNAFLHGRSEARLTLEVSANAVHLEVGDDSPRHPTALAVSDDAVRGRGMAIVDVLATAWGVRGDTHGKTVWFRLTR